MCYFLVVLFLLNFCDLIYYVCSCWIWLSFLWCFSLLLRVCRNSFHIHSYKRFVRNNTDNCTIALLHVPFSHLLSSCSSCSFCFHLYLFLHFLLLLTRPEILVERILIQEKDSYLNWTFCRCWFLCLTNPFIWIFS